MYIIILESWDKMEKSELKRELTKINDEVKDLWRSLSNSRRFNNSMVSSISFFKLSKELTVFFISDVSLMNCSAFF